jgi:two-component system, chemotaxis family, chemotaxis protein CheY
MRAIVVDDSKAMRRILTGALKTHGFEVLEASTGKEAIERLRETGSLDLALIDWNMPEMTGIELVELVRADTGFAGMRLMMVTTETEPEQVERALVAGADEYLMKPFTVETLELKLQTLGLVPLT